MKHAVAIITAVLLCSFRLSGQEEQNQLTALFSDTSLFHCTRVNINTDASDFGVVKYRSGYVFASSRNARIGVQHYAADTLSPLLDLYYFAKKDSGRFTHPKPFSKTLNSIANDGPITFSHDGMTAIFTRSRAAKQDDGELTLTLMTSTQHNGRWSAPEPLPFCQAGFNYVDPSLSADDSILYFASDCSGGYGGMDLYSVKRSAGGWSRPVNLGRRVNTSYNETFPYCTASGNLYFSSNRPGGPGLLDLYAWTPSDSLYMRPQLLPAPLNSAADDFAFSCSDDETEGFFSSNRNNRVTDDDIYHFQLSWQQPSVYDTLRKTILCYTFVEDATYSTSDTAAMAYTWSFSDGSVEKGLKVRKCFDTTGVYGIHLDIRDSSGGDVILSSVDYDLDITPANPISVFIPDTVPMHQALTIRSQNASMEGYTLNAVYYDFGRGYRSEGITASHVYHHPGVYYPKVFFRLKSRDTGATECRCLVAKIIVQ